MMYNNNFEFKKKEDKEVKENTEEKKTTESTNKENDIKGSTTAEISNINNLGTPNVPNVNEKIHTITIIGHIEGHTVAPPHNKTTKYEHIIPQLVAVEENPNVEGMLVILNTVGGDVEAGLAISELINSLSKPKVTLVLGGSHSIGVPLATSGDYSFIAPTATMTIHPIRMTGLVIGVPQTFKYFAKMQDRIIDFIVRTSEINRETIFELMNSTDELANDVGSVLIGEEAVKYELINEVGGLDKAMLKLHELIKRNKEK